MRNSEIMGEEFALNFENQYPNGLKYFCYIGYAFDENNLLFTILLPKIFLKKIGIKEDKKNECVGKKRNRKQI